MLLSDFLRNGSTMRASAGPAAIASNDLLEQNILGALSSVKVIDYAAMANAGGTPVAATTYAATSPVTHNSRTQVVTLPDGSFVVADSNGVSGANVMLWKYSALGALLVGPVTLDGATVLEINTALLANGNIAVAWVHTTAPFTVFIAVVDPNLNVVTAATSIGTSGVNPGPYQSIVALSGGGFMVSWTKPAVGIYFAVFTNAGAVTQAAALFAGTPAQTSGNSLGMATTMAELSNANVAVAFADTNTHALGYAILSAAGGVVAAYSAIGGALGGTTASWPEISVLPGYFCVAPGRDANSGSANAYVLNNAGALQGAGYIGVIGNADCVLANDGVDFWMYAYVSPNAQWVRIPVTGTNYQVTTVAGVKFANVFYENGGFVGASTTALSIFVTDSSGAMAPQAIATATIANASNMLVPVGDCCVLCQGGGIFQISKYANTTIVGVSQQPLGAGNAGTLVSYSMGPGGYPCNAPLGSKNKAFDHSGANLIGNKGVFLAGAVTLRGI